ncbi:MAG TPA: flagellar protein FlbD [Planctomycetes bacterium]|nr:flagellar protein FlbD [Planctomycetota bacterium]
MIRLTRPNGQELHLNGEMLKWVESSPDTILTLVTGETLWVLETVDEVNERFGEARRAAQGGRPPWAALFPEAQALPEAQTEAHLHPLDSSRRTA